MQLGEAKTKALKLIAEYSNNGAIISDANNADYKLRMNSLAQAAQEEIALQKPIHATYSLTQNPIPNQLGIDQGYDLVQHLSTDYAVQAIGSRSYYFEVDRQATVYIEELVSGVWTLLNTITVPPGTSTFTTSKGLITPSSTLNNVRLRFAGAYPYNIRNVALYKYPFPDTASVPDYRPFVKYTMPSDFRDINKIVFQGNGQIYTNFGDYYWEGRRVLVVSSSYAGSIDVFYFKYPTVIDETTADTIVFELDPEACEAIPYYLAAHVAIDEPQKQNMVQTYLTIYNQKLSGLETNMNNGKETIQSTSGW